MKYVNMVLCVLMVLFMVVQFNDPDGLLWMAIYSIPAVWAGLAGFRINTAMNQTASVLLGLSVALMLVLTVYYYPHTEGFWHKDVWWITETAREGMGMMIATLVTLVAAWTIWSARKRLAG